MHKIIIWNIGLFIYFLIYSYTALKIALACDETWTENVCEADGRIYKSNCKRRKSILAIVRNRSLNVYKLRFCTYTVSHNLDT